MHPGTDSRVKRKMNRSAILTSNIAGTAMRDVLLVNDADAAGQEENSGQSRTCWPAIPSFVIAPSLSAKARCVTVWGWRVGSQHATRATAIHTATAADQVTASVGLTPWSSVASSREARAEISNPIATPAVVTRKPWAITSRTTSRGRAPRATGTPISRVRAVTWYASTPYIPTARRAPARVPRGSPQDPEFEPRLSEGGVQVYNLLGIHGKRERWRPSGISPEGGPGSGA